MCVVASRVPPTGDLACNPGMCPDWELNWRPFNSQSGTQSTEPHQPGQSSAFWILFSSCSFFFKILFIFILERGGGQEKEKERNIDMREIHQLVASCTPSTGDLACTPGMCPDWELNRQTFGSQALNPLSHTSQGCT